MSIIDTTIHRSRTFFLILGMIFIIGIYSYVNIPKESKPDIPLPTVYISLHHEGISPEDAVNLLVKPMEKELRNLEGLDELEANAFEGGANITVKFIAGLDSDKSVEDVRNKVDIAKAELPEEADEPKVIELNIATFPVLTVILKGDLPEREVKRLAEDLQDTLEGVDGVLEVKLKGMREEQLLIELDKALLESYAITPQMFFNVISNSNLLVAAGSMELKQGKYAVKVPGLFETAEDLLNLPLIIKGDRTVRIRDVGTVKLNFKDSTSITRVNGERAVTLEVSKRIGENIIETVDAVKEAVKKESNDWPKGLEHSFTGDASKDIRNMLYDLQNNVLMTIILVMIVILAALGPRSAGLVATAIPGSFLIGIIALNTLGFTVNVVVLFALILSVGMLVDGAIVVSELADKRMREGAGRKQAFSEAAKYMSWPIIASTATTLAAFMPLLGWPDIVGEFMKFMPLTLIFTLTGSLIMALIFLPLIGAHIGHRPSEFAPDIFAGIAEKYRKFLIWSLERPKKILLATIVFFILVIMNYMVNGHGVEFFPKSEPERANILVHSSGDYSIAEKDKVMHLIADRLVNLKDAETVYVETIGSSNESRSKTSGDLIGKIFIQPVDWHDRDRNAYEIFDDALDKIGIIPGVSSELEIERGGPQQGKPIQIAIRSDKYEYLPILATKLREGLEKIPGTTNIADSLPEPGIEWNIKVNREEAAKSGTSLVDIGTMVRLTTTGAILGTYRPENSNDEIDIVARLKQEDRSFSVIDNMTMATTNGERVPLSNFIERTPQQKVTTIRRLEQKNVIYVEADVKDGYLANDILKIIKTEVEKEHLPHGVSIEFKGDDEQQKNSSAFLQKAFLIAIFVMAMILVTQFNNFYQAWVILSAVILSTAGVLLGHLIMVKPFGIVMSGLGIISLAGIVVNNNIVLIDTYNKLKETMEWHSAIVETGVRRLRPVLLTAITTIVGLIPMGFKLNFDLIKREVTYNNPSSQWWDQLANSIMFGLAFATILTLIVTPCMMALPEIKKEKKQSLQS